MNDRNTIVGERFEPTAHHHRREDVLCQYVDHYHPRDDQQRPSHTKLGQGQDYRGRHRQHQARCKVRSSRRRSGCPHSSGKSTPNRKQHDRNARARDEVDYGAQPELAHHSSCPTSVSLATCGLFSGTLARSRFIMAGPSASKNSMITEDQEQVAQECRLCRKGPRRGHPCQGARLHHVLQRRRSRAPDARAGRRGRPAAP